MQGKTVLITGADRGIGRETTKALAKKCAAIIMACIDLDDAKPVCEVPGGSSPDQYLRGKL